MTELIAGVDEVGRGPLAGAVVAAAVVLDPNYPILGTSSVDFMIFRLNAEFEVLPQLFICRS